MPSIKTFPCIICYHAHNYLQDNISLKGRTSHGYISGDIAITTKAECQLTMVCIPNSGPQARKLFLSYSSSKEWVSSVRFLLHIIKKQAHNYCRETFCLQGWFYCFMLFWMFSFFPSQKIRVISKSSKQILHQDDHAKSVDFQNTNILHNAPGDLLIKVQQ